MQTVNLHLVDYTVLIACVAFVLGIGWMLARYMKTSSDFLTSGRSIPMLHTTRSTVPLTAIGPVARPVAPLPKLRTSLVVVVLVKTVLTSPVELVLQKASVPQMPAAVPKPAVAPSESQ